MPRLGPNWQRPKGMKQLTNERLLDMLADSVAQRDRACTVAVAKVLAMLGQR
jgi:hypothetical protein